MEKKHNSRILEGDIARNAERVARNINTAIDVLEFMKAWNDDELQIIEFAKQRITRALGDLNQLEDRVKRLADLADPTEPDDLPF